MLSEMAVDQSMIPDSPREDYGYDSSTSYHTSDADIDDVGVQEERFKTANRLKTKQSRKSQNADESDVDQSTSSTGTQRRKHKGARKSSKVSKTPAKPKPATRDENIVVETIGDDCEWSDNLLVLGTKELNEILKKGNWTLEQIAKLKAARRRAKNRTYALRSRQKKSGKDQTPCPGPSEPYNGSSVISKETAKSVAKIRRRKLEGARSKSESALANKTLTPNQSLSSSMNSTSTLQNMIHTKIPDRDSMMDDTANDMYFMSDDLLSECDDLDLLSSSTDTTEYDSMDSSPSLEFSALSLAYDSDGFSSSASVSSHGSVSDSRGMSPIKAEPEIMQVPSTPFALELETLMGELRNDYARAHSTMDQMASYLEPQSETKPPRGRRSRSTTPTPADDHHRHLPASLRGDVEAGGLINDLRSGFTDLHSKIDTWTHEADTLKLLPSPPVLPSSTAPAFSFPNGGNSSMDIEISADSARARSLSLGGNSYDYFSAALLGLK